MITCDLVAGYDVCIECDVGDVWTDYKWGAGFDLVNEETDQGVLARTYYGRLADVAGTDPATGVWRYYHHDHLGSTRRVTDQSKNTLATYEYAPYGEDLFASGPADIMYHYATLARDTASGLDYAPFRYYSPGMGRWTTRDPLGMVDGPNIYPYVAGDPVNGFDPTGQLTWQDIKRWFGGHRGDWTDRAIDWTGTCLAGWILGADAAFGISLVITPALGGVSSGGAFVEFPEAGIFYGSAEGTAWGLSPGTAGAVAGITGSVVVSGIEYFLRPFTGISHALYNGSASLIGALPARYGC